MKGIKKIQDKSGAGKLISVGLMFFCLLFLTGVNFFVYPPSASFAEKILQHSNNRGDEKSPSPVEEESSSKPGVTVQEEYIHETHIQRDVYGVVFSATHKIPDDEKLQIVHFELVSPPPKI